MKIDLKTEFMVMFFMCLSKYNKKKRSGLKFWSVWKALGINYIDVVFLQNKSPKSFGSKRLLHIFGYLRGKVNLAKEEINH